MRHELGRRRSGVEAAAKLQPVRETRVHERLEGGAVVVNLQMGQFVDDHILHEIGRASYRERVLPTV